MKRTQTATGRAAMVGMLIGGAVLAVASTPPPPDVHPSNFTHPKTNKYFPLRPGTVYYYREVNADGIVTGRFEVTEEVEMIMGVPARVVFDQEFLNGELVETTRDWYAPDNYGNVWYMGEDTHEIANGQAISSAGSWRAGVDGARAGIYMAAQPVVGVTYYEEFYEGEAEDKARVLSLNKNVKASSLWPYPNTTWPFIVTASAPASDVFRHCVKTRNWNPLHPGPVEYKYYAPGVGVVLEVGTDGDEVTKKRLVNITLPGG